jgi:intermembrane space import and assembly protein 40
MAHGPCGEEFKAAFSCFVYSSEEPKGMDCIDKFQHMQDCFRQYPEIYGAELQDDEDDDSAAVAGAEAAGPGDVLPASGKEPEVAAAKKTTQPPAETEVKKSEPVQEVGLPGVETGGSDVVPRAAVDATDANKGKEQ